MRLQLVVLRGVLVQEIHTAGYRVSRGVIAADDQQDQVAQKFHGRHVLGMGIVGHHGDEVGRLARVAALAFFPQAGHDFQAFHQRGAPYLFRRGSAGFLAAGRHVGPVGQLTTFFEREVEQGREHLCRQLDADLFHPVEFFIVRQAIQDRTHTGSDQRFQFREIGRRDHAGHGLSLHVVLGRVHSDEVGRDKV